MSPYQGIHTIDTGFHRPRLMRRICWWKRPGAFIDNGTSHSVPALLDAVVRVSARYRLVDPDHVHLDHAGGAGACCICPMRVLLHRRGAPHMIDPAKLIAGATAVYGEEEVARSYGDIVPIPAERVDIADEGHVVDLAGRSLLCLDTPGHAAHHICIWDAKSRNVFSGDTFGISYRELDSEKGLFIFPTTTPVQFDPVALKASIQRLIALQPDGICLTHYAVSDERHAATLIELIDDGGSRRACAHAPATPNWSPRRSLHPAVAHSAKVRNRCGTLHMDTSSTPRPGRGWTGSSARNKIRRSAGTKNAPATFAGRRRNTPGESAEVDRTVHQRVTSTFPIRRR